MVTLFYQLEWETLQFIWELSAHDNCDPNYKLPHNHERPIPVWNILFQYNSAQYISVSKKRNFAVSYSNYQHIITIHTASCLITMTDQHKYTTCYLIQLHSISLPVRIRNLAFHTTITSTQ